MSEEARETPDDETPHRRESIEATLEAVDRWVKRFDRDMGAPSQEAQPVEERISEAG